MTTNPELDVLVISFRPGVTVPMLDSLALGGQWEHIAVPAYTRDCFLTDLRRLLLDMTAPNGKMMRDPSVFLTEGSSDD